MSDERFILAEDSNGLFSIFDNEDKENEPLIYGAEFGTDKIVDLLNELAEENEQLRKQIQNYEKLLSNSYVGEEERLDGFFGKYEIWEDELQEYKNKKLKKGDD